MLDTLSYLEESDFPSITRTHLETLQVNLGYRCNQQCFHCHVDASPRRKEEMTEETIDTVKRFLSAHAIKILDLTGGAPEMNPHFKDVVTYARSKGIHVIDRCNLTILEEPGYEWLASFLADQDVEVIASLPCYLEENVEAQRGKGIFATSIKALQKLNGLGYGRDENRSLNLVYNPQGAVLPPSQEGLEQDYKKVLAERYEIEFDHLFTITNMPIKRFGSTLLSKKQFEPYMDLLKSSYQEANLQTVMCRSLLSVDWQGYVYDCDFNQMLNLSIPGGRKHLNDLMDHDFAGDDITVLDHCYGCTAGQGSSCGGALSD